MPGQIWKAQSRDLNPRTSRDFGSASPVIGAFPIVHHVVVDCDGRSCIPAAFEISPIEVNKQNQGCKHVKTCSRIDVMFSPVRWMFGKIIGFSSK